MKKSNYVPRLYDFLRRLSQNNDRTWFKERKAEYDELRGLWENDLSLLLADMSQWEPGLTSQTPKTAAYRIYRDIRFKEDKSPYKTYFSAYISPYGKNLTRAGYYLQMGPQTDSGLYGGLWFPDSATLKKVRKAMVDNIEEIRTIINSPDMKRVFPEWCGDALKTVPKGYDRNHPDADLLRLKDIGKWLPCDERWFSDPAWPQRASEMFAILQPLVDFLNYSIEEE